jgi:flagellar hook protein FlgE
MLQALFNSLSGLFAFSKSLDTVSNNIANMNTPGFRGSDSYFENVMDGFGTRVEGTGLDTTEGQIEQTGVATDLAINGEGLFVLKDPETGSIYYTRAGQFVFDSNGYLVDSATSYHVEGIDANGDLTDININRLKTLPAQATTTVNVTGNISPQDSTTSISSVTVYDAQGVAHTYSATLTNNTATTPGSWLVSFTDSNGNAVGNGEIRFNTDGSIQTGYNTIQLGLDMGGGVTQNVVFNFGAAGTTSGTTSYSGISSQLNGAPEDGHGVIGIASYSFDQYGTLQLTYSDQETKQGPRVALAAFPDEHSLQMLTGRLYQASTTQARQIGGAGEGIFGQISGGSLEMSNVDLTQELADMIVIQRGYQASSRVMTVTNSMLQDLYDSTRSS